MILDVLMKLFRGDLLDFIYCRPVLFLNVAESEIFLVLTDFVVLPVGAMLV